LNRKHGQVWKIHVEAFVAAPGWWFEGMKWSHMMSQGIRSVHVEYWRFTALRKDEEGQITENGAYE
jgi:hypothetical protein